MTMTTCARLAAAGSALLLLGACANGPRDMPTQQLARKDPATSPARALVLHVLCDISHVSAAHRSELKGYQVVVSLTLKVEDSDGLTPSLSFITPMHPSSTSQTNLLGGEITQSRMRTLIENDQFDLAQIDTARACDLDPGYGREGDFRIATFVEEELSETPLPGLSMAKDKSNTIFGTTVQFALKQTISGGPTWVKVHFKGPSDKGLFSGTRQDTSTLVIGFAKTEPAPKVVTGVGSSSPFYAFTPPQTPEQVEAAQAAADEGERARAAERARQLVNQMVLQNLVVSPQ